MIESAGGSLDEVCAAKRKVAEAYLHENNQQEYEMARLSAAIACQAADLERLR